MATDMTMVRMTIMIMFVNTFVMMLITRQCETEVRPPLTSRLSPNIYQHICARDTQRGRVETNLFFV